MKDKEKILTFRKKELKKYLETELKCCEAIKELIDEEEADIYAESNPETYAERVQTSMKSDDYVINKILKKDSSLTRLTLKRILRAKDKTKNNLTPKQLKLFKLYFEQHRHPKYISSELEIGDTTFYDIKNYIIKLFGKELGYF